MIRPRNFRLCNPFPRFFCCLLPFVGGLLSSASAQSPFVPNETTSPLSPAFALDSPLIRVGLMHWTNVKRIMLQSFGGARLIGPDGCEKSAGVGAWTFTRSGSGYLISDAQGHTLGTLTTRNGNAVWRLQCDSPDALACIRDGSGSGRRYHGSLEIGFKGGLLTVINEVTLEKYLCGVVSREMGKAPDEALKAQAVAARTFAVHWIGRRVTEGYDVRDSVESQAYSGVDGETAAGNNAVFVTTDQILMSGDHPILAQFCADCGGMTAPGSPSDDCPGCASDADAHGPADQPSPPAWTFTVPASRLLALLKPKAAPVVPASEELSVPPQEAEKRLFVKEQTSPPLSDLKEAGRKNAPELLTLEVTETDPSGRARKLRYQWRPAAKGHAKNVPMQTGEVGGNTLRTLLGLNMLKSTLFTVTKDADGNLVFTGRGYGHGHGLCQTGAIALAGEPFRSDYRTILARYYAGTAIGRLTYLEPENEDIALQSSTAQSKANFLTHETSLREAKHGR